MDLHVITRSFPTRRSSALGLERDGEHRKKVACQTLLKDGETLMLKGQPDALERAIASHGLLLAGQHREVVTKTHSEDVGVIEAVVTAESMLVGRAAGRLRIHERYGQIGRASGRERVCQYV